MCDNGIGGGDDGGGKKPGRLLSWACVAVGVALVVLLLSAPQGLFLAIGLGVVCYLLCRWLLG